VEFNIDKVFKGPEINSVVVNNSFSNSCSSSLLDKNSNYYLFLLKDDSTGNYSITSGTFVKVDNADGYQLNTKLSAHKKALKEQALPNGTMKKGIP